jgi:hypothetical protein
MSIMTKETQSSSSWRDQYLDTSSLQETSQERHHSKIPAYYLEDEEEEWPYSDRRGEQSSSFRSEDPLALISPLVANSKKRSSLRKRRRMTMFLSFILIWVVILGSLYGVSMKRRNNNKHLLSTESSRNSQQAPGSNPSVSQEEDLAATTVESNLSDDAESHQDDQSGGQLIYTRTPLKPIQEGTLTIAGSQNNIFLRAQSAKVVVEYSTPVNNPNSISYYLNTDNVEVLEGILSGSTLYLTNGELQTTLDPTHLSQRRLMTNAIAIVDPTFPYKLPFDYYPGSYPAMVLVKNDQVVTSADFDTILDEEAASVSAPYEASMTDVPMSTSVPVQEINHASKKSRNSRSKKESKSSSRSKKSGKKPTGPPTAAGNGDENVCGNSRSSKKSSSKKNSNSSSGSKKSSSSSKKSRSKGNPVTSNNVDTANLQTIRQGTLEIEGSTEVSISLVASTEGASKTKYYITTSNKAALENVWVENETVLYLTEQENPTLEDVGLGRRKLQEDIYIDIRDPSELPLLLQGIYATVDYNGMLLLQASLDEASLTVIASGFLVVSPTSSPTPSPSMTTFAPTTLTPTRISMNIPVPTQPTLDPDPPTVNLPIPSSPTSMPITPVEVPTTETIIESEIPSDMPSMVPSAWEGDAWT